MPARRLSRDERALWRAAIHDVRPLAEEPRRPVAEEAPPSLPEALPSAPVPPAPLAVSKAKAELVPGTGMDRRSAARFKRGQLPIEGRIDLHGMTQDEAHPALLRFIARAYDAGLRTVLVITGKGARGGPGVLKRSVPLWLEQSSHRSVILAIGTAQPKDGGGGAFYIMLRRRR